VANCVRSLIEQGAGIYLIDNESTDGTVELVREAAGPHLLGVETFPFDGVKRWRPLLERKETVARTIDADWVMHVDADEIHLPPRGTRTLAEAFAEADAAGHNAVDFAEFTFVPVAEDPDHDHPEYLETMRWYYAFLPSSPHHMRAWRRHPQVELAWSGGHLVDFPGLSLDPRRFRAKHYLFLSVEHAVEKYVRPVYDPDAVAAGWHGWRAYLREGDIRLPAAAELRLFREDDALDDSDPRAEHVLDDAARAAPV